MIHLNFLLVNTNSSEKIEKYIWKQFCDDKFFYKTVALTVFYKNYSFEGNELRIHESKLGQNLDETD